MEEEQITFTQGGDFTLTGSFHGTVVVDTEEQIKLQLQNVSVTSETEPCIFVKNADRVILSAEEGTQNTFTAEQCETAALYAKDDLVLQGSGAVTVNAPAGHGIKADWMMVISGGTVTVNAADTAVHCLDEIDLTGGKLTLASAYGKGVSGHGNVTVDGAETVLEVPQCTEGLESKKTLTVNDGTLTVVASDDALNGGGTQGIQMGNPPSGNRPGIGEQSDMGERPDMSEQPDMSERPDIGKQPNMGEQPNMSKQPDMSERPDMGDPPDIGKRPDPERLYPDSGAGRAGNYFVRKGI